MIDYKNVTEVKQVVANGFITYTQEIVELAKQGYVLDISNEHCPLCQLGLFTANMLMMKEEPVEEAPTEIQEDKPKRTYTKAEQKKAAVRGKVPADAIQTVTE